MICGVEFIKRGFGHLHRQGLDNLDLFLEIHAHYEELPLFYKITGFSDTKLDLIDKDEQYRNLSVHSSLVVKSIRFENRLFGVRTFVVMGSKHG